MTEAERIKAKSIAADIRTVVSNLNGVLQEAAECGLIVEVDALEYHRISSSLACKVFTASIEHREAF